MSLLCKLGFHKDEEIGRAYCFFKEGYDVVAFGCKRCGRKSEDGRLMPHQE